MASSRKDKPYLGPVTDVRFVQLPDGRRVLQVWQPSDENGWSWRTPETVVFSDLPADEREELSRAFAPIHHENGDGVS